MTTTSTAEEITKRYRRLALLFHPDKNKSPSAEEAFKAISNAYTALKEEAIKRENLGAASKGSSDDPPMTQSKTQPKAQPKAQQKPQQKSHPPSPSSNDDFDDEESDDGDEDDDEDDSDCEDYSD